VQERIKRLEKMERIEIPESLKKISITFPPPPHSGRIALSLAGIGKSYGARRIFSGLDLTLESGEKLLVVGRNGAGKTTLLRILAGVDTAFDGSYQYGAGIAPGYFSQDAAETMSGARQVIDFMEAEAPTALVPRVRDMLGAFLFRGDDVYKPIGVLSGGEKSRLALLRMLLKPMNLLILDEPTNHLDLQSKDILLDTLKKFKGTIIFVSHDRGFMEALSTKTLELAPAAMETSGKTTGGDAAPQSRARLFYGNYGYYLDRVERDAAQAATLPPGDIQNSITTKEAAAETAVAVPTENVEPIPARGDLLAPGALLAPVILIKASEREKREAAKQQQTLIRRLERQEAEILKALEDLEAEKTRLEAELSRPEVYSNGERAKQTQAKLNAVTDTLNSKTAEWEEKAEELTHERSST
jgi:ATP-binding cassette subfamily F protein 3